MSETALLVAIREALSREPGVLIWRNNSGRLQDAGGRWVQYGLGVGGADLVGVVAFRSPEHTNGLVVGRLMAIEVKTATGKMRKEQECWARAVRKVGGFCCTVRSIEDAMGALARCRQGATE